LVVIVDIEEYRTLKQSTSNYFIRSSSYRSVAYWWENADL